MYELFFCNSNIEDKITLYIPAHSSSGSSDILSVRGTKTWQLTTRHFRPLPQVTLHGCHSLATNLLISMIFNQNRSRFLIQCNKTSYSYRYCCRFNHQVQIFSNSILVSIIYFLWINRDKKIYIYI